MSTRYEIMEKMSWQMIEDKVYMKDEQTKEVYYFEEVAARIMKGIFSNLPLDLISREIADYYEVEIDSVAQDTKDFIGELIDEGIVKEKTR